MMTDRQECGMTETVWVAGPEITAGNLMYIKKIQMKFKTLTVKNRKTKAILRKVPLNLMPNWLLRF